MIDAHTFNAVAEAVKLAVAPVFLLTALGSMLGVLTNRIARIVDRARFLEQRIADSGKHGCEEYHADLAMHGRRARLIQWAISLCTITALLVCTLTALMFVIAFFDLKLAGTVALLFILAMVTFITALMLFLREIHLAIASIRF
jgi:ABC-type uncharacterized transport system fused permease/ATPase subunit